MNNVDIRILIKANDLKQYQVAEKMGITVEHLSRVLKGEITQKMRDKIMKAIEELVPTKNIQEQMDRVQQQIKAAKKI